MGSVLPHETSRYLLSEEIELDDGTLLWTAPPVVEPLYLEDDIAHVAGAGETFFTLAMRYYIQMDRPEQYYWAIMDYQDPPMPDPMAEIPEGTTIIIPSLRTLQDIILNEDRVDNDPRMLVAQLER